MFDAVSYFISRDFRILAPFLLSVDISSRVVFYTKSTEARGGEQNTGCLSFTRANWSVHGLSK